MTATEDALKAMRFRLMTLHQEKLEPAMHFVDVPLSLGLQEVQDLCEFMANNLYDEEILDDPNNQR